MLDKAAQESRSPNNCPENRPPVFSELTITSQSSEKCSAGQKGKQKLALIKSTSGGKVRSSNFWTRASKYMRFRSSRCRNCSIASACPSMASTRQLCRKSSAVSRPLPQPKSTANRRGLWALGLAPAANNSKAFIKVLRGRTAFHYFVITRPAMLKFHRGLGWRFYINGFPTLPKITAH